MEFALPQVILLGMVPQPCQFQAEVRLSIPQVDDDEAAVGRRLPLPHRLQAQGLLVERKRFVQIRYIEIEVIECQHKLLLIAGGPLPPAWFGFSIAFLPPPGQGPFQTLPAASSFYPCYTISREKFVGFWLVL